MSRISSFAALLLAMASSMCHAVDENRLWLPVKYQTLYLSLVKAASVAEALDRCVAVVEGTLDLEQSTSGHPIFRILCRQENGRTYSEMVDGMSFATLTTREVVESDPTFSEVVESDLAPWKLDAWLRCREQLIERTQLMLDLQWLTEINAPVEPENFTAEEARFSVEFDARSMAREWLHYKGECVVGKDKSEVSLRRR